MAAPLIHAHALGKAYGGRTLFDEASFQIEAGQHVAIVGPNGAGKSTLLRILAGRTQPDHGTLRVQPVRHHWFDQHPHIPEGATAGSLLQAGGEAPADMLAELAELEARIADPALYEAPGYEEVLERYHKVEQDVKLARSRASAPISSDLLEGLGIKGRDLAQDALSLSGGERTRIMLARTLAPVQDGDLLVLDEPTNHLDVDSIEWLEEWIDGHPGTVLVVAHDRAFLDNVAHRVLEVSQGHVTAYDGNYEDYIKARDEEIERKRRDHEKAQDKMQAAKDIILQYRQQKRFDGQYASKMKALDKYKAALDKTPDPVIARLGFGLAFDGVEKSGLEIMRMAGVTKSLGGAPVLKGADLEIKKGERVGLVGANGAGKSTLLSILTGKMVKDAGILHIAPGVRGGVFSQEQDDLDPKRTVRAEILDARFNLSEEDIKALAGRFRFDPSVDLTRTVSTLSGGERQRLKLLKCILRPSNLLILDEPTNHLDLWARDVVVKALNSYGGTLLVVSHDRYLLDSVTESTAVLEGGHIHQYQGSFSETRALHRKRKASGTVGGGDEYIVERRFADWANNQRYVPGQQVRLSEEKIQASMGLRNALLQGWLVKK